MRRRLARPTRLLRAAAARPLRPMRPLRAVVARLLRLLLAAGRLLRSSRLAAASLPRLVRRRRRLARTTRLLRAAVARPLRLWPLGGLLLHPRLAAVTPQTPLRVRRLRPARLRPVARLRWPTRRRCLLLLVAGLRFRSPRLAATAALLRPLALLRSALRLLRDRLLRDAPLRVPALRRGTCGLVARRPAQFQEPGRP